MSRCPSHRLGPRIRRLGLGALFVTLALSGCERTVPADEIARRLVSLDRPNLVLIVVDTLRADTTTPYGAELDTSPELARWAERGVVFERARAQSSWTKISMASLLTSLWPRSHAIREYDDGLGDGALTLAELLQGAGYATYGIQTNGWLHQSFGFHQGFERYLFPLGGGARRIPRATIWAHADNVYLEVVRLVDAHDSARPFFLYAHFMDVHEYAAPAEFQGFGTDGEAAYRNAIRWIDDAVERIRRKLDAAGYLDRTVMLLASDHGEAFGENGRYGHARNVLTPVLWVPLVMRLPFPIEPLRIAAQVRNLDIAPTLLDLAGVPVPERFEGRSLLPLVAAAATGSAVEADRVAFAGLGRPLYRDASIQASVNDGAWTLARNVEPDPHPGEFLFDRGVDPGENVNLIGREPEAARRMRRLLDAYLGRPPLRGALASEVRIDPEIRRRLEAMGYVE